MEAFFIGKLLRWHSRDLQPRASSFGVVRHCDAEREYFWGRAMLPEKFLRVLEHEGVVAICTQGANGQPHLVNTWNSYIQVTRDEHLLVPVGGMHKTEKNLSENNAVLLTAGSREVEGKSGAGAGFLIRGNADFVFAGVEFDLVKSKFPWARAALKVKINDIAQTL